MSRGQPAAPRNGRDYQMLKPAELPAIDKFAILILSESHGTTTRETTPPWRIANFTQFRLASRLFSR